MAVGWDAGIPCSGKSLIYNIQPPATLLIRHLKKEHPHKGLHDNRHTHRWSRNGRPLADSAYLGPPVPFSSWLPTLLKSSLQPPTTNPSKCDTLDILAWAFPLLASLDTMPIISPLKRFSLSTYTGPYTRMVFSWFSCFSCIYRKKKGLWHLKV